MAESLRITYRGSPALVSALASMLGAEGLTVSWEPPIGQRGAGEYARTDVELTLAGGGTIAIRPSARAAVTKFKERLRWKPHP